jgi:putative sigma-54 modulation protein
MNVQIRANGTKVTEGMREFVDARMQRLDKMIDNVVDAQLELRTESIRSGGEQTSAQLTVQTGRHVLRAEVRDLEASKAIDQAIDKLERQIRKFNDKRKDRKGRAAVSDLSVNAVTALEHPDGPDSDDDDLESRLVRIKRFAMKPMDIDEAIDQLELVGHDFFLFLNEDESKLNVLYRRRDGTYGLLAPN